MSNALREKKIFFLNVSLLPRLTISHQVVECCAVSWHGDTENLSLPCPPFVSGPGSYLLGFPCTPHPSLPACSHRPTLPSVTTLA